MSEERTADITSLGKATGAVPQQCHPAASQRVVSSSSLLAGATQLAILHNETVYFLRQTRFGKLILTK